MLKHIIHLFLFISFYSPNLALTEVSTNRNNQDIPLEDKNKGIR